MTGILDDVRVIDLSEALAGPYASWILGQLGADIIKIEKPGSGDMSRSWKPPEIKGESAYYLMVNSNKRSIVLNLKSDKGREVFYKLIERGDVVLENYRPGVTERLGIDYKEVSKVNPGIIYCSISGFGQTGLYTHLPGYDLIAQAMGGIMSATGEENRPPIKYGVPIADIGAGMYAALAILTALINREKTGKGTYIDVSLLDVQVSWLTNLAAYYFGTGKNPKPLGSAHPQIAPYQAFKAKDGYFVLAVGSDRLWINLCNTLKLK